MSIWRPHTTAILVGGVVVVIVAAAIAFMVGNFQPKTDLKIGSGVFSAKVAQDIASQETGLAGVKEMKPNDALIIAYDKDETAGIWMKGMLVSIDAVWLNGDKEVIHIVKNMTPAMDEKVFKPTTKARYVIELPAGSVQLYNIKVGDSAKFVISKEHR